MSDLRDQLDSRSPAHKAELLDAVWESQEADSLSLTDPQRAELDHRIERHEQDPSHVIPGKKSREPVQEAVTLPVVWIPEADADVKDARAWYDQIRPELGERFALAIEATVESIARASLAIYRRPSGTAACRSRRFPHVHLC